MIVVSVNTDPDTTGINVSVVWGWDAVLPSVCGVYSEG
jgi:hypothetical protein